MKNDDIVIAINLKIVGKILLTAVCALIPIFLFLSTRSNPDADWLYSFKRLQEDTFLKMQTTPHSQLNFYSNLLDERLSEMQYLIKQRKTTLMWSSSLRYSTTAGRMTELLLANNLPEEKKYIIDKFNKQQTILKGMEDYYYSEFHDDNGKYIRDGINYLDLYKEKLTSLKF